MDKELIKLRFRKAVHTYEQEATVQKMIASQLINFLKPYTKTHDQHLLEIGCGTGVFTRELLKIFTPQTMILNDLCPEMREKISELLLIPSTHFYAGDAEKIELPTELDWIFSCSTIQWFNDPETFFKRCNTALKEAGYLAFSTFGEKNLHEINQLTGNSLPYLTKAELEQMLSTNYTIINSYQQLIPLHFNTPKEVLYHLKNTGVTALQKQVWTKKKLAEFYSSYEKEFKKEDKVSLTYHPIYIIVQKKKQL